jgi:ferrous iron transport protein B
MSAAEITAPTLEAAVDARPLRIALAGVPNCGKTALFNALTGARQKVANYAGVTVERKEGVHAASNGARLTILDLPGTYSLRARSPDEAITRDAVLGKLAGEAAPDVIVCVADATSLRVALRLVLELKAAGRPLVLALNMIDIAARQGLEIDVEGCLAGPWRADRRHRRHPPARHRGARRRDPDRRRLRAGLCTQLERTR